ncbi:translation initiation factor IF-2-like [Panthera leo]|uniref:translation initiation factor IF-2-like n=1 Tax=Panthera leo TaxID=9689 RepID=UPI001C699245|nr:translation initiation factor IF-2-like [Panthera leo]
MACGRQGRLRARRPRGQGMRPAPPPTPRAPRPLRPLRGDTRLPAAAAPPEGTRHRGSAPAASYREAGCAAGREARRGAGGGVGSRSGGGPCDGHTPDAPPPNPRGRRGPGPLSTPRARPQWVGAPEREVASPPGCPAAGAQLRTSSPHPPFGTCCRHTRGHVRAHTHTHCVPSADTHTHSGQVLQFSLRPTPDKILECLTADLSCLRKALHPWGAPRSLWRRRAPPLGPSRPPSSSACTPRCFPLHSGRKPCRQASRDGNKPPPQATRTALSQQDQGD